MRIALLVLTLALAPGCAVFEPGPVQSPPWSAGYETRSLDNPRLKGFIASCLGREIDPWPPSTWDLDTLTLAALYYSPDLDIARARLAQAKAGVTTASRIPNPTADSRYQYVSNPDPDTPRNVLDSSVMFPVEAPGKRRNRIAQAEHLAEAARLNIERAAWEVRGRVRASVIDLCEAAETEALLRRQCVLEEENIARAEQRADGGELSPIELPGARASLGEAEIALSKGRQQAVDARLRLAAAVGVPPAAVEPISVACGPAPRRKRDLSRPDLQRRALRARADILSSLADYAACQSALQSELAARFPDLQLGSGFEWDQGEEKWGISASVPLPILDRNQGPIAEARARIEESAARFTALQSQVIGDIDRALAARAAAQREIDAAGALLGERERQVGFLKAMTRPGEVRQIALYRAEGQRIAAAIAMLGAKGKGLRAEGDLEDAVQQPLFSPDDVPSVPELLSHFQGER
ncbi:MAG: TolC family protein [Chlamydiota bacterium]